MALERVRVMLVDDHELVRGGIKALLQAQADISVVAEAGSVAEAVREAAHARPDVIVMDVRLADGSGIEATREIRAQRRETQVLMLTSFADDEAVFASIMAGASGYVLKEAVDTDVVAAVREVAGGGRYVHPALGARLVEADAAERRRVDDDPLSDREHAVLRLLALGHTNQEIADTLFISVRTAETHRAHIMRKLGLESRAELVRYALQQGLLDAERG